MGKGGTTTQNPEIPAEMKPLISQTANYWQRFQNQAWDEFGPGGGVGGLDPAMLEELGIDPAMLEGFGAGGAAEGEGIFDEHAREVAGLSDAEKWAKERMGDFGPAGNWGDARQQYNRLGGLTNQEKQMQQESQALKDVHKAGAIDASYNYLPELARKRISGEDVGSDPAITAALKSFDSSLRPLIENQSALSGLGRSTAMTNASGAMMGNVMLPLVQESIAREERRTDRRLGAEKDKAGGLLDLGRAKSDNLMRRLGTLSDVSGNLRQGIGTAAGGLTELGDREQQTIKDKINMALGIGGMERGIDQERMDADQDDWLMRRSTFENAMGAPLGILPSTIGSRATQGKK